MSLLCLARGNHNNKGIVAGDMGRTGLAAWYSPMKINAEGNLVDQPRIMTHPAFDAVEGEGIYTYPRNPDMTSNFIYAPIRRKAVVVQATVASAVNIDSLEPEESVIITETWAGGSGKFSTFAEMARTLYEFCITDPPLGEYVGWQPADVNGERYNVELLSVELGGRDFQYFEHREDLDSSDGAFVRMPLVVKFKMVTPEVLPESGMTLVGL